MILRSKNEETATTPVALGLTPTDVDGDEARRELDRRDASHVQIPALSISVLSPTIHDLRNHI
jgi:hypothetical protein